MAVTEITVEKIKAKLRNGGLFNCRRQTGKSTAILELCAEFGAYNCLVIAHSRNEVSNLVRLWEKEHHKEKPPEIITVLQLEHCLAGRQEPKYIFVDEPFRCGWFFGEFYAAIGTAPFPVEMIEL